MTPTRRLAPVTLALTLAFSTAAMAAPIAPAQKGESTFKSIKNAFKAGVSQYKERRAAAGPGLIKRSLIRTGEAINTGVEKTMEAGAAVGKAVGNGAKKGAQATARGVKNSLVARMTIGVLDGVRATGRVIASPFKRIARAIKAEKAAIKQERMEKVAAATSSMGLRELSAAEQSGKLSRRTVAALVDMRTAQPMSREKAMKEALVSDPNVGLRELEQMAEQGRISHETKQQIIDERLAKPASRASLGE